MGSCSGFPCSPEVQPERIHVNLGPCPPQEVFWDELTQGLSFLGVMQLETLGLKTRHWERGSQEGGKVVGRRSCWLGAPGLPETGRGSAFPD